MLRPTIVEYILSNRAIEVFIGLPIIIVIIFYVCPTCSLLAGYGDISDEMHSIAAELDCQKEGTHSGRRGLYRARAVGVRRTGRAGLGHASCSRCLRAVPRTAASSRSTSSSAATRATLRGSPNQPAAPRQPRRMASRRQASGSPLASRMWPAGRRLTCSSRVAPTPWMAMTRPPASQRACRGRRGR
jgi:hypothetical protein